MSISMNSPLNLSANQGMQAIGQAIWFEALQEILHPWLLEQLIRREPGHCLRLSGLPIELMRNLCQGLREHAPQTQAYLLVNDPTLETSGMGITATKLIELRNPLADGSWRPPLLICVPHDTHAAAEDSFAAATFEVLQLPKDLYERLKNHLFSRLSDNWQEKIGRFWHLFCQLNPKDSPRAKPFALSRFLLSAYVNQPEAAVWGMSLYELGMIPDSAFFTADETEWPVRIEQNQRCVSTLLQAEATVWGNVLQLELSNRELQVHLVELLRETGFEDPNTWRRRIALETSWRQKLDFKQWVFNARQIPQGSLKIHTVEVELPIAEELPGQLADLTGQRLLSLNNLKYFNVKCSLDPAPSGIPALTTLVAHVISLEQGTIAATVTKKIAGNKKHEQMLSFKKLKPNDWDEGWYFVRILPRSANDEWLTLVDEQGKELPWARADAQSEPLPHESDLFYVLNQAEVEIEPVQRAVPKRPSLMHAWLEQAFMALNQNRDGQQVQPLRVEWTERKGRGRATGVANLQVRFSRGGSIEIPVPKCLQLLEQELLNKGCQISHWELTLQAGSKLTQPELRESLSWPEDTVLASFLAARERFLKFVLDSVEGGGLIQALNFRNCHELILNYAQTYLQALETCRNSTDESARDSLLSLMLVDTVRCRIQHARQPEREVILVAPTHPLRTLWLLVWSRLGLNWLQQCKTHPEWTSNARDIILSRLQLHGFPAVVLTPEGRLMSLLEPFHQGWSAYAYPDMPDPAGVLGDLSLALGIPASGRQHATADFNGNQLALKIKRYLIQHPYVDTLVINAFYPGRATLIADVLIALQEDAQFKHLRYDLRLFVPDPEGSGVGESLISLTTLTQQTLNEAYEAFSTPARSYLRSKLRIALQPIEAFRLQPIAYPAHLSFLFEVFPSERIGALPLENAAASVPLYGLIQDFGHQYHEDGQSIYWQRFPRFGLPQELENESNLAKILAQLASSMTISASQLATGQSDLPRVPVFSLVLTPEARALLHQVHEVSDWVFTLDQNLGLEYFDHGGSKERPDYLIDHSPALNLSQGRQLMITSRSLDELYRLLKPVLESYQLQASRHQCNVILRQLRSLSGRLALKLLSCANQRAEVLGLALSRLYLESLGVFKNQLVIPLDAHLELYRPLKRQAEDLGEEISFKRTDLAIFDLDATQRRIVCRLVEVKCVKHLKELSTYQTLKEEIKEQLEQSEQVLRQHFDPQLRVLDWPLKVYDLSKWLSFYLDRAQRYELIAKDAFNEAYQLLATLDQGYELTFTRSGLIFDMSKPGSDEPEEESRIEYHRIGIDAVVRLLSGVERTDDCLKTSPPEDKPETSRPAFLSTAREHHSQSNSLSSNTIVIQEHNYVKPQAHPHPINLMENKVDEENPASLTGTQCESQTENVVNGLRGKEEQVQLAQKSSELVQQPEQPISKTPLNQDEHGLHREHQNSDASNGNSELVSGPTHDILLGVTGSSPQYGLLGEASGYKIALDLNQTHTISLFGVQGGGKSYTLGTIVEMATQAIPGINQLPKPLSSVIFHYSNTMDYQPEYLSLRYPNSEQKQVEQLNLRYGAQPQCLSDVILLVPDSKLPERKREFPNVEVFPLKFSASELQVSHWRFLMGAVGNQAVYIRQLQRIMRTLGSNICLQALRDGIDTASLPDHLKDLAHMRLEFAADYIDDQYRIKDLIKPGRLLIVDLRDEFIEKDEALGLFVVLLQLVAEAQSDGERFNKLVVFDEAHKYMGNPDLVAGLVEVVREMRHKGLSFMIASQDPPSVPVSIIELSSQIILHKFNSPAWLKHIQKANAALLNLTAEKMVNLKPGEAYVWSSKASDPSCTQEAIKISCRPRVTAHGGATKTAIHE